MVTPAVTCSPRSGALDPSAVRRWVERTCAEQDLRVLITDRSVLAQLVVLFGQPNDALPADTP